METFNAIMGTLTVLLWIIGSAIYSSHSNLSLWTFWLSCVCAITGLFGVIQDQWNKKTAVNPPPAAIAEAKQLMPETTGVLIPGVGETPTIPSFPPNPRLSDPNTPPEVRAALQRMEDLSKIPRDAHMLFLGNVVTWTPDFPLTAIGQGNEDMVLLEKEGDGLLVSAKFFSKDGNIICEIIKNQFHLNPNNYFRMERAPHKLIVFDNQAKPAIQVEFINKHAIRIYGDFYLRDGHRITISREGIESKGLKINGAVLTLSGGSKRIAFEIPEPRSEPAPQTDPASERNSAGDEIIALPPTLRVGFSNGMSPAFDWTIKNVSTHVLRFRGVAGEARLDGKEKVDFAAEMARLKRLALVNGIPGDLPPDSDFTYSMPRPTFTKELYESVVKGSENLFAHVAIVYTDSSNRPRCSTICYRFDPTSETFVAHAKELWNIGGRVEWSDVTITRRPSLDFVSASMVRFEPSNPLDLKVAFTNTGGTTAFLSQAGIGVAFLRNDQGLDAMLAECMKKIPKDPIQSDLPALRGYIVTLDPMPILPEAEVAGIKSRKRVLTVFGRIEFHDEENGTHWTNYCLTFDGSEFHLHPKFNTSDQNEYGQKGPK